MQADCLQTICMTHIALCTVSRALPVRPKVLQHSISNNNNFTVQTISETCSVCPQSTEGNSSTDPSHSLTSSFLDPLPDCCGKSDAVSQQSQTWAPERFKKWYDSGWKTSATGARIEAPSSDRWGLGRGCSSPQPTGERYSPPVGSGAEPRPPTHF